MIGALYGCGCEEPDNIFLGQDATDGSIDLSTVDFGNTMQPVVPSVYQNLAPTSFPSLDSGTIIEPSGSFQDVGIAVGTDPALLNNPLPTTLPPADVSAADTSLMPTPSPISVPGSSGSTAADIIAGGAAAGSLATALAKVFGTTSRPTPPAGYTYNAAGQLVPATAVPAGYTLNAAGQLVPVSSGLSSFTNWLTGSTLISSLPNWAVVGGGVAGVMLLTSLADSGGGGRRRR